MHKETTEALERRAGWTLTCSRACREVRAIRTREYSTETRNGSPLWGLPFLCAKDARSDELELEAGAQLNEERIRAVTTGKVPDGLLEHRAASVALILLSEVHGIEEIEELGE